jgi:ribosome-binding protein aMBF1 (putative translation factor)
MPPKLASDPPTPLREVLERIGMSHSGLARELGVDRRQARTWITGEYTPEPERREQIAKAVSATAQELWPDADPETKAAA